MLKMIVDAAPEGLENYYTKTDDGKFRLNVEDAVHTSQFDELKKKNKEFRDTNANLLKTSQELGAFADVFGGVQNVTPEALHKKIEEQATRLAEQKSENMRKERDDKFNALNDTYVKTQARLSQMVLGDAVLKAAVADKALDTAHEDIMFRAQAAFKVEEGELKYAGTSNDSEGKPFTIATWMKELQRKAPHLFATSQGLGVNRNQRTSGKPISSEKRGADDLIASGLANRQTNGKAKRLT